MKPKNVIVWILLLGIVALLMSTSVQAKELTEVNATDILEKIEKGEDIFFENVRIIGELDLSKIRLITIPIARSKYEISHYGLEEDLKIVESKIEIRDSVFEDDVDFSNTQFKKNICIPGNSFLGKIDFRGAVFSGDTYFSGAKFSGDADFECVDFSGDTYFSGADFSDDANFWGANFSGDATFVIANFCAATDFQYADFSGYATFGKAKFSDKAYFSCAKFIYADFLRADFSGDAFFSDADFSGDANFRGANFSGDTSFYLTEFNKVTFTGASFTSVSLNETDFNRMYVGWSSLKDALVFNGLTYIKLIKNFREMEQFEDVDAAYYQYRRLSHANKKWSSKLINVVAGASCGYGVKPERPLIWAFVLIMVFTLVYWRGKGIKRLKENDGDKNRVSRWAAFYNSFYFSVVTFTTVGYGDWYPEDRYRIVVMIEGVFGWLLLALFIVTLANVMIRP